MAVAPPGLCGVSNMMCSNFFCCEDADNTFIDRYDASLKEQGTLRGPN